MNFFGRQEIGHHCYRLQLPPGSVLPCEIHLHCLVLPLMRPLQFPQPLPFLSTPWNLPPSIHHLSFLSCTLLQHHHQHQTPKRQQFQTLTLKLFCRLQNFFQALRFYFVTTTHRGRLLLPCHSFFRCPTFSKKFSRSNFLSMSKSPTSC